MTYALAALLARARADSGMGLTAVRSSIDGPLSESTLCRILRGDRPISIRLFVALCFTFGLAPGEVLTDACRMTLNPVSHRDVAPLIEGP
ncbi:helix-turn-helix domain-containing protein [Amycolatopsis nigrescens]|uniref:helix-turn-helix domain-containing protein n=1 Tax=Amycolatopsis nigrescens TaxID=381445 RepID=UPI0012F96F4F|nr:helix-turn-helix domain-containing protein [Amycolatopsis nigrescens]